MSRRDLTPLPQSPSSSSVSQSRVEVEATESSSSIKQKRRKKGRDAKKRQSSKKKTSQDPITSSSSPSVSRVPSADEEEAKVSPGRDSSSSLPHASSVPSLLEPPSVEPPVLKLKKQPRGAPSPSESATFVDVKGTKVEGFVAEHAKTRASRHLGAISIFTIEDNVQIFYINPDGSVHALEDTSSLHLVRLYHKSAAPSGADDNLSSSHIQPFAFLHAGDWLYPLIPDYSPALITAFGTYIFPDLKSKNEGAAIALVLPQFLSSEERERFEVLLDYYASVEDSIDRVGLGCDDCRLPYTWSDDTVTTINEGDWRIVPKDLSYAAVFAIKLLASIIVVAITLLTQFGVWIIRTWAGAIRSKANRSSRPYEVDPQILRGVLYAKSASDRSVIVTGYIVENLQEEAMSLSRRLAPRPSVLIPGFLKETSSALGIVLHRTAIISATAYDGMGDIYASLGEAAATLFDAFSEETVKTVEHRYGEDYGTLAKEAFGAASNVKKALKNTQKITSFAFVPTTIQTRVAERIETSLPSSDVDLGLKQQSHADSTFEKDKKKKKKTRKIGALKAQQPGMSCVDGHHYDTESASEDSSQKSLLQQEKQKESWFKPSPTEIDRATMLARTANQDSRRPSHEMTEQQPATSKESLHKDSSSSSFVQSGQQTLSESVDSFHPVRDSSTESLVPRTVRRTLSSNAEAPYPPIPPTRADSSASRRTLDSFCCERRKSSSALLTPTRRQSVFLSPRRQSMHVVAAMAAVMERQYRDPARAGLLAGGYQGRQRSRLIAAATSITRAKIRRRHREKSQERFLVVVQLSQMNAATLKRSYSAPGDLSNSGPEN